MAMTAMTRRFPARRAGRNCHCGSTGATIPPKVRTMTPIRSQAKTIRLRCSMFRIYITPFPVSRPKYWTTSSMARTYLGMSICCGHLDRQRPQAVQRETRCDRSRLF